MEIAVGNVLDFVGLTGICSGCGGCAGLCPNQVLTMEFNSYGEYVPVQVAGKECVQRCSVCLRVCPFASEEAATSVLAGSLFAGGPGTRSADNVGYYQEAYVGCVTVDGHRARGASGGLATWFLESLIRDRIVDRVGCVVPTAGPDKLFSYTTIDAAEDVRRGAGSSYYPVELSHVVTEILLTDARYALTGLPCVVRSLRLAMRANPRLRARIVVLAGLVCGQGQSKHFASYACALGGGSPAEMRTAKFRVKSHTRPATDHGFEFACLEGTAPRPPVFWSEGMGDAWSRGYFRPSACDRCVDVFAEVADIVFMDAWLAPYDRDSRGTSIAVARSALAHRVLKDGIASGKVGLAPLPIADVRRSQAAQIEAKDRRAARVLSRAGSRKSGKPGTGEAVVSSATMTWPTRISARLEEAIRSRGREVFAANPSVDGPAAVRRATRTLRFAYAVIKSMSAWWRRLLRRFEILGSRA